MQAGSKETIKNMTREMLVETSDQIADFFANETRFDVDTAIKSINSLETVLAIHSVFDMEKDFVIFDDVAHAMTHQFLRGRDAALKLRSTLPENQSHAFGSKTYEGGKMGESLGVALTFAMNHPNVHTLCIMDDYVLNYGTTYESLLQISKSKPNLTLIFVEEQQSLLRHYNSLDSIINNVRISKTYSALKKDMKGVLDSNPVSRPLLHTLTHVRDVMKETILEPTVFNHYNIGYHGPIDGQNLNELIRVFEYSKRLKGTNVIHIQTRLRKKTRRNINFPAFKTDDSIPKSYRTYHEAFDTILAKHGGNLKVLVDSLALGDYFAKFEARYPEDYIVTTGSPEALVAMASGYAIQGYKVVVAMTSSDIAAVGSSFVNQFAHTNSSVTLLVRSAGLYNAANSLKQGLYDIDSLIDWFDVMNPATIQEGAQILDSALSGQRLTSIRYQNTSELPQENTPYSDNDWDVLLPFDDASTGVVFTTGAASQEFLNRIVSSKLPIGLVHCRNVATANSTILKAVSKQGHLVVVYAIDSKHNFILDQLGRFTIKTGHPLNVHSFDLESIVVDRSPGILKRLYHLHVDDVLNFIMERNPNDSKSRD